MLLGNNFSTSTKMKTMSHSRKSDLVASTGAPKTDRKHLLNKRKRTLMRTAKTTYDVTNMFAGAWTGVVVSVVGFLSTKLGLNL